MLSRVLLVAACLSCTLTAGASETSEEAGVRVTVVSAVGVRPPYSYCVLDRDGSVRRRSPRPVPTGFRIEISRGQRLLVVGGGSELGVHEYESGPAIRIQLQAALQFAELQLPSGFRSHVAIKHVTSDPARSNRSWITHRFRRRPDASNLLRVPIPSSGQVVVTPVCQTMKGAAAVVSPPILRMTAGAKKSVKAFAPRARVLPLSPKLDLIDGRILIDYLGDFSQLDGDYVDGAMSFLAQQRLIWASRMPGPRGERLVSAPLPPGFPLLYAIRFDGGQLLFRDGESFQIVRERDLQQVAFSIKAPAQSRTVVALGKLHLDAIFDLLYRWEAPAVQEVTPVDGRFQARVPSSGAVTIWNSVLGLAYVDAANIVDPVRFESGSVRLSCEREMLDGTANIECVPPKTGGNVAIGTFGERWSTQVNGREVVFLGLPVGTYRLKVRGRWSDGSNALLRRKFRVSIEHPLAELHWQ